jgi:hypothetical protein
VLALRADCPHYSTRKPPSKPVSPPRPKPGLRRAASEPRSSSILDPFCAPRVVTEGKAAPIRDRTMLETLLFFAGIVACAIVGSLYLVCEHKPSSHERPRKNPSLQLEIRTLIRLSSLARRHAIWCRRPTSIYRALPRFCSHSRTTRAPDSRAMP